uniref:Uncharacterized protein n=1 Tax=Knipowitschia caucasica TaxID=637954 RepID=A0AAV2L127_KNICA
MCGPRRLQWPSEHNALVVEQELEQLTPSISEVRAQQQLRDRSPPSASHERCLPTAYNNISLQYCYSPPLPLVSPKVSKQASGQRGPLNSSHTGQIRSTAHLKSTYLLLLRLGARAIGTGQ